MIILIVGCNIGITAANAKEYYEVWNRNTNETWGGVINFIDSTEGDWPEMIKKFDAVAEEALKNTGFWKNNPGCEFIKKLSNFDWRMIERGLELMDAEPGEVYEIIIAPYDYSIEKLFLVIKQSKSSFAWGIVKINPKR